jgi:hypothetical protein
LASALRATGPPVKEGVDVRNPRAAVACRPRMRNDQRRRIIRNLLFARVRVHRRARCGRTTARRNDIRREKGPAQSPENATIDFDRPPYALSWPMRKSPFISRVSTTTHAARSSRAAHSAPQWPTYRPRSSAACSSRGDPVSQHCVLPIVSQIASGVAVIAQVTASALRGRGMERRIRPVVGSSCHTERSFSAVSQTEPAPTAR